MNNNELQLNPINGQPNNMSQTPVVNPSNMTTNPNNVVNVNATTQPNMINQNVGANNTFITPNAAVQPQIIPNNQQQKVVNQQVQPQPIPVIQQQPNMINQIQGAPTVEQSKQQFINSIQTSSSNKKEDKDPKVNYVFIIILFALIFACMFFLFPFLQKYI